MFDECVCSCLGVDYDFFVRLIDSKLSLSCILNNQRNKYIFIETTKESDKQSCQTFSFLYSVGDIYL